MNKVLFKQHEYCFSQADGTPPTQKLVVDFGRYTELPMGVALCTGELDIDNLGIDRYTNEFLRELQRKTTDPQEINITLSDQDVKVNYKN
eukprot:741614-Ditylum_brightwellii.AAC.1